MKNTLKPGTRVVMISYTDAPAETGTVIRWHPISGPRSEVPDYHRIRFVDGGIMLVHRSNLIPMEVQS